MMEAVSACETSFNFYKTTRHSLPEDSLFCCCLLLLLLLLWGEALQMCTRFKTWEFETEIIKAAFAVDFLQVLLYLTQFISFCLLYSRDTMFQSKHGYWLSVPSRPKTA
jgi:hypothetical protein